LSWLLEDQPTGTLAVYACTAPGWRTAPVLDDGSRLRFVGQEQADFAVCAPRGGMLGIDEPAILAEHPTMHTVSRDGTAFLYVKDLRQD